MTRTTTNPASRPVVLVAGEGLSRYGFADGHPFGPDRQDAFLREMRRSPAYSKLRVTEPRMAERAELESFHRRDYVDLVLRRSGEGRGYLDAGDTPASKGIFEASSLVVGATLCALEEIVAGNARRAFIPIAGLHHASRTRAAGFCVFNDCGVAIELLRRRHGIRRVAYVDIDAHHGDGVFYAFESDPDLLFADIHEDGRYLYPGTGAAEETGAGEARGTKLNLPLPPGATDDDFLRAWRRIEGYLLETKPDFILLQCGADSLAGDPITHLAFSEEAHAHAAAAVCLIADQLGHGRVLAMGGGGYNRQNLARAWTRVVEAFVAAG
ncbi:MAG TPA: acetoin utilization protein AcuC [Steroidobacteraceae bacterium]|nr:acetoin utilization protein AcuC [Steroidobacteraceae bacterium]